MTIITADFTDITGTPVDGSLRILATTKNNEGDTIILPGSTVATVTDGLASVTLKGGTYEWYFEALGSIVASDRIQVPNAGTHTLFSLNIVEDPIDEQTFLYLVGRVREILTAEGVGSMTPIMIRDRIATLVGDNRLDVTAIKGAINATDVIAAVDAMAATIALDIANSIDYHRGTVDHPVATSGSKGMMSVEAFNKLAGIQAGATVDMTPLEIREALSSLLGSDRLFVDSVAGAASSTQLTTAVNVLTNLIDTEILAIPVATDSINGLMSSEDFVKLRDMVPGGGGGGSMTPTEIRNALASLTGSNRLSVTAVQNAASSTDVSNAIATANSNTSTVVSNSIAANNVTIATNLSNAISASNATNATNLASAIDVHEATVDHPLATNATRGFMSPADFSKLGGIEANATGDMTATEIQTALATLTGSNRLDVTAISNAASVTSVSNAIGAHELTVDHPLATGSTRGMMAPSDFTKLAGIQAGATDDLTATEIRNALSSLNGTNRLSATAIDGIPGASVRYTFSNANFAIPSDADVVDQIGTMTAARTVTLPAIASVSIGKEIVIRQLGQDYGGLIALRIAPSGTDLVEGSNQPYRIPFFSKYLIVIATAIGWRVNAIDSNVGFNSVQNQRVFTPSSGVNEQYLASGGTGAGSTITINPSGGFATLATGTTSAGAMGIFTASRIIDGSLSAASMVFHHRGRFPILSTATERYQSIFGFSDTTINQHIFIRYVDSESANLRAQVAGTLLDTGVLVQANTWYEFGIFISDQTYFVINEALVATGVRLASTNGYRGQIQIAKTVGTSSRSYDIQSYALQFPRVLNPA